ncbi:hypothetical protein CCB80_00565 [Armatimonadetes bacterium Uphvl-Ar1]|nr:hypothetical protein CCB80_00565 [Armatimonadetes bacterium Uphvl-Ar1]
MSALALGWLALPSALRAELKREQSGSSGERIEVVLAEVHSLARALIADSEGANEEAYLQAVIQLLARMEGPRQPWFGWDTSERKWDMDTLWYSPPVILYQLKFEPDAVIDLHDHRHYNGLIIGVEGELNVRNFDIVDPSVNQADLRRGKVPPKGAEFLIKQSAHQVLRPGKQSTLTRDRDNLHVVRAGASGATCLDLFTHFNREARSYSLEWKDEPIEKNGSGYRASWR